MSRNFTASEVLASIEQWAVSRPATLKELLRISTKLPAEFCKEWQAPDCHEALTQLGIKLPQGQWGDAGAMFAVRLLDLLGAADCADDLAWRSSPGKQYYEASAHVLVDSSMESIQVMVSSGEWGARARRFLGKPALSPSEAMSVFQALQGLFSAT